MHECPNNRVGTEEESNIGTVIEVKFQSPIEKQYGARKGTFIALTYFHSLSAWSEKPGRLICMVFNVIYINQHCSTR